MRLLVERRLVARFAISSSSDEPAAGPAVLLQHPAAPLPGQRSRGRSPPAACQGMLVGAACWRGSARLHQLDPEARGRAGPRQRWEAAP